MYIIKVKTCQHIEIAFGSKKKFVANNLIQIVKIIKNNIFAIIINILSLFHKNKLIKNRRQFEFERQNTTNCCVDLYMFVIYI